MQNGTVFGFVTPVILIFLHDVRKVPVNKRQRPVPYEIVEC